jgi:hypothetical protein
MIFARDKLLPQLIFTVHWELAWRDPVFWVMSALTRAHNPKYGPYRRNSWTHIYFSSRALISRTSSV